MEWQWFDIFVKFCKVIGSYVIALLRLFVWTAVFFFSGLQRTLFTKAEVVGVDFKIMPLRCYREELDDKLAYLDKLCIENPDLIGLGDDEIPFDSMIPDEENNPDDGRFEDNGEDSI